MEAFKDKIAEALARDLPMEAAELRGSIGPCKRPEHGEQARARGRAPQEFVGPGPAQEICGLNGVGDAPRSELDSNLHWNRQQSR